MALAVSTYSYWHFKTEKYPIEKVIEHAAAVGFEGVEILHRQMADETPAYVNGLKRAAFRDGLSLPMLSIHQDFVHPDPAGAREGTSITRSTASQLAAELGIPVVRLNSGRWKTIKSFDDLMKVKGDEPPLAGPHERRGRPVVHPVDRGLPAHRREGGSDAGAREPLGAHDASREPAAHLPGHPLALARASTSTPAISRASPTPGSSSWRRTP